MADLHLQRMRVLPTLWLLEHETWVIEWMPDFKCGALDVASSRVHFGAGAPAFCFVAFSSANRWPLRRKML